MVIVRHEKNKEVFFVNGKTVICNENGIIAEPKLSKSEEKLLKQILKKVR